MKKIGIELELLSSLYHGNQFTLKEISKIFNCSNSTICGKMKDFGIPSRDWNGIREINKHFVTKYGIIDVNEFPNYKNCLKKVDLQSTKKPKPITSLEYTRRRRRKIKKVESKKIWEYF